MTDNRTRLEVAAQAVVDRWDSPLWDWRTEGPTADLIATLRAALAEPEPRNQCGETCERAKLCAVCARGLAEPQQEPRKLRRGDILRCIETDELCTVWATSTTGKTLIKWSANNFGEYTAAQIGELFWVEPRESEQEPVGVETLRLAGLALLGLSEHDQHCEVFDLDDEGRHKACTCGLSDAMSVITQAGKIAPPKAEPVQEPVYWEVRCTAHPKWMRVDEQQFDEYVANGWEGQRLYTDPPQRKPLTDEWAEKLIRIYDGGNSDVRNAMRGLKRAIEAAHNIKENT